MSVGRRLLEDDESVIIAEWRSMPKSNSSDSFTVACKYPEKNRYADVLASDNTRVKLSPSNDNPDGYINANFVSLPLCKVIASQAPLPDTFHEFWQMIWVCTY